MEDGFKLFMLEVWVGLTMFMFQIQFAMVSTLIRLLAYAFCIRLTEDAYGFGLELSLGRRGNLVMGFFMLKIWIAMVTLKTFVYIVFLSLVIVSCIWIW